MLRKLLSALFLLCGYLCNAQLIGSDPVCGRWRLLSGGAELNISPSPGIQGEYLISVIDAEDMSLPAGTHVGSLRRTATPGRYIASLLSNPSRIKSKKRNLVVTLRPEGSLSFEPYRSGKRISLWRWIPYLFRVTVVQEGHQPADIEGAVRPGTAGPTRHRIL